MSSQGLSTTAQGLSVTSQGLSTTAQAEGYGTVSNPASLAPPSTHGPARPQAVQ
jgi:hypothetical protein